MNAILLAVTETDFGLPAGAMAAAWFDTTPDPLDLVAPNCTSMLECTTMATDGTLWEVDGFGGDGDNLWLATGVPADDLSQVGDGNATAKFGFYNFSLNILYNGTGQTLVDVNCTPFCGTGAGADGLTGVAGSGDLLGGENLENGAFARSDFDFQKNSVPEPATLALVGLALLGYGHPAQKGALSRSQAALKPPGSRGFFWAGCVTTRTAPTSVTAASRSSNREVAVNESALLVVAGISV